MNNQGIIRRRQIRYRIKFVRGKGVRYNREFKISVFVIWLLPDDRPVAMATGVHVQGGGGSWLARVKPEKHVEDV